jgi:hypothetical protein
MNQKERRRSSRVQRVVNHDMRENSEHDKAWKNMKEECIATALLRMRANREVCQKMQHQTTATENGRF